MRILVRLFASYREAAGRGHMDLHLPEGATVRDAVERIRELFPLVGGGNAMVCARNRRYVGLDEPLGEGDELALIPPVSGGAVRPLADIEVTAEPLSVDDALDRVRGEEHGGLALFAGTVRSISRGKRVVMLEYEAYPEMAAAMMAEIAREAERRWGPLRIVMHHRVGRLAVGETAVVIAVGAPHRAGALEACRFAIDRLKESVPIWKKEHSEDGAVWIEDHP